MEALLKLATVQDRPAFSAAPMVVALLVAHRDNASLRPLVMAKQRQVCAQVRRTFDAVLPVAVEVAEAVLDRLTLQPRRSSKSSRVSYPDPVCLDRIS